jgi:hypothetical protein
MLASERPELRLRPMIGIIASRDTGHPTSRRCAPNWRPRGPIEDRISTAFAAACNAIAQQHRRVICRRL